ncbi:hypothetical protein Tco_0632198, partial [Tanacetum coccineum]
MRSCLMKVLHESGPEEPEQAPLLPDYVAGLEYPEYLAPVDDKIIDKDQPYAD